MILLLTWGYRHLEDEGIEPEYDSYDYHQAHAAYQQAQANFEQADPQYIDIAVSDMGISENRVDNELRKIREGGEYACHQK